MLARARARKSKMRANIILARRVLSISGMEDRLPPSGKSGRPTVILLTSDDIALLRILQTMPPKANGRPRSKSQVVRDLIREATETIPPPAPIP